MKDVIKDTASEVTSGLIKENAIIAFLLFIIALLLAWFLYTNHTLQQQVVDMQLSDYKRDTERFQRIDALLNKLDKIGGDVAEIRNSDIKFSESLRAIRNRPCVQQ